MLKGVTLTLMIGPGLPTPAPRVVTDALTAVRVNSDKERGGFQLTFGVGKGSPLVRTMLPAGFFDPMICRAIIVVTVNGTPHVLMDGVITRQEVTPSDEPGKSTLTLTGEDLSVLMNVVEMPFKRFPAMPEIARVYATLGPYAAVGVVPVAIPPVFGTVPIPTEEIPAQTGTDLEYLRKLAEFHGYVFYVEPGPAVGTSVAYWGPDVRLPIPQPALSINFDADSNAEALTVSLDGTAKKVSVFTIMDPVTKKIPIPIPVPNVSILRPPLGLRPTPPARVEFPEGTTKLKPAEAAAKALGILFRANSDAVTASGSLDVSRYGHVLRSRQLVGVRGAGLAYDGLYYVNSVTHDIKGGQYKQTFSLSRDGLISNTPRVPT